MNLTQIIEQDLLKDNIPHFVPGDTLKLHVRVVEGSKERTQIFQGVVIRRQGTGARETFTVRKLSYGVGVERTFPVHSPVLAKIEVTARGDVRRAKLYYLRDRIGKAAKVKEKRFDAKIDAIEAAEREAAEAKIAAEAAAVEAAEREAAEAAAAEAAAEAEAAAAAEAATAEAADESAEN